MNCLFRKCLSLLLVCVTLLACFFQVSAFATYRIFEYGIPEFFNVREGMSGYELAGIFQNCGIDYTGTPIAIDEFEITSAWSTNLNSDYIMKTSNGLTLIDIAADFFVNDDYIYNARNEFEDDYYDEYGEDSGDPDYSEFHEMMSDIRIDEHPMELYFFALSFSEDLQQVVNVYESMYGPSLLEGDHHVWRDDNGDSVLTIWYSKITKTVDVIYW